MTGTAVVTEKEGKSPGVTPASVPVPAAHLLHISPPCALGYVGLMVDLTTPIYLFLTFRNGICSPTTLSPLSLAPHPACDRAPHLCPGTWQEAEKQESDPDTLIPENSQAVLLSLLVPIFASW